MKTTTLLRAATALTIAAVFTACGDNANAPTDAGKKLPKVVISDVVSRPETLREALTDLWKIAHGPPRVVTVQRWNLLEPLFERVRQAHAEAKWRFVSRDES